MAERVKSRLAAPLLLVAVRLFAAVARWALAGALASFHAVSQRTNEIGICMRGAHRADVLRLVPRHGDPGRAPAPPCLAGAFGLAQVTRPPLRRQPD
jgi:hypothetical protein